MVCYYILAKTSFFSNKLFKRFILLECKLQFGMTIRFIEVSKQKLHITMSLYVYNKTYCKEIHPEAPPFPRAKGSREIPDKHRHRCCEAFFLRRASINSSNGQEETDCS